MLAIIRALKKMVLRYNRGPLSHFSQYDGKIVNVKGEDKCPLPLHNLQFPSSSTTAETKALPVFHNASTDGIVASILSHNLGNLLSDRLPSLIASVSQPNPAVPLVLSTPN
jgi:hypothetical protein